MPPTGVLDQGIDLPPGFRLIALREAGDAFAHAKAVAAQEGAGTVVNVGRFDLAEFAVVLEPDEPLRTARRAFYAGCVALADALATFAPPERPVEFVWPDTVQVDGGLVGGVQLAWPSGAADQAVPDWIVFGVMVRTIAIGEAQPGLRSLGAALDEEGFDDVGAGRLLESFTRHLMTAVDIWQHDGFGAIERSYLERLPREPGVRHRIDENGDLLIRRAGKTGVERRALLPQLALAAWFDQARGGPRT
jgi:biotin-(acetyl-CoA carboxylase) ligase